MRTDMRALLALIIVAACATGVACAHAVETPDVNHGMPEERFQATVEIVAWCGDQADSDSGGDWFAEERRGFATVTGPRTLATAAHLVDRCPAIVEISAAIRMPGGRIRTDRFVVRAIAPDRDVAELELRAAGPPLPYAPASPTRRPGAWPPAVVCFAVATWGVSNEICGPVTRSEDGRLIVDAATRKGQSGAGAYDATSGELVGVLSGTVEHVDGSRASVAATYRRPDYPGDPRR